MKSRKLPKWDYSTLSASLGINMIKEMDLRIGEQVFFAEIDDGSLRLFLNKLLNSTEVRAQI